ncbi:MAG TPA: S-formylglutathione hydrolase [Kiloniellales bacterium]
MSGLTILSEQKCFEGLQGVYSHASAACGVDMRFALFQPPQALDGEKVPVVTYLSGLTCTEENFTVKAGAQRWAAELGLLLVCPDTSPRGPEVADDEAYDLGTGAGFYVDATEPPWSRHYRMYSYVTEDLAAAVAANFPADSGRQGIFGHSMGGHGALVLHLRNPEVYSSVSAFAPIVSPMYCPWGEKAFTAYLGAEREAWRDYDSCELVRRRPSRAKLFVDQGTADDFLGTQLKPDLLVEACEEAGQHFELRMQPGYDHSYFFIQSFVEDHLRHHAAELAA